MALQMVVIYWLMDQNRVFLFTVLKIYFLQQKKRPLLLEKKDKYFASFPKLYEYLKLKPYV